MPPTHEVFNQPPALTGYDVAADPALLAALRREGAGWAAEDRSRARPAGRHARRPSELGRLANEHPPVLRTHDRYGHRIDEVEFHPAWHELMTRRRCGTGCTRAPWRDDRAGRARGPRRRLLRLGRRSRPGTAARSR